MSNFSQAHTFFIASVWMLAGTISLAQVTSDSTPPNAQERFLKGASPIYPAIANAARVVGEVVVDLQVENDGHVSAAKAVSGPPMLLQTSLDAVKKWEYQPFSEDGKPKALAVRVTFHFSVGTSPPNDAAVAQAFFPLSQDCVQKVGKRAPVEEQTAACKKAAEVADKFGPNDRFIERRSAYVYYAMSLIRAKDGQEALTAPASGSSAAYSVRAQAKALSGDLDGVAKTWNCGELRSKSSE